MHIHIHLNQADQTIQWWGEAEALELGVNIEGGLLLIQDTLTGEHFRTAATPEQVSAIVWLALNGDIDPNNPQTIACYNLAEPLFANASPNLRPIP